MRSISMMCVLVGGVALMSGPAVAQEEVARQCSYSSLESGEYHGPCTETWLGSPDSPGDRTIEFDNRMFTIQGYQPSRRDWNFEFVTINDMPAVGYMHHRSFVEYTTEDLSMTLSICDQLDAIGSCE